MEKVPIELKRFLAKNPKASTLWKTLTPIAQRDFITWIEGAKEEATRARRIARTSEMLLEGKRRPCCYAVVPMNLYKALGGNKKAKTQWGTLTPGERRDLVAWVEDVKGKTTQAQKVEKVCALLEKGRRRP